ncbi:hypothetical protein [Caulobacter segnis]
MAQAATAGATSTDHFVTLMNVMREHHKAMPGKTFALNASPHYTALMALAANDDGSNSAQQLAQLPPAFDDLKAETKAKLSATATTSQTGVQGATNDLSADKNSQSFMDKMKAQRDAAKQANNDAIDAAYDKAIQLGNDHPELQGVLPGAMGFVSDTITTVVSTITNVIEGVLSKIGEILSGLIDGVTNFIKNGFAPIASILSIF